ncbi:MAG: radical SAM family heme chaperone HemW [Candidatus Neomarinimicrobiota bacterium]|nr:radical SAM family heme chaperone HemW [Candidatus Neomarinimicrobiota bacterium]
MSGLYIHIPFCRIKCMYCDFYSVADRDETIPSFFEALFNEIRLYANHKDIFFIDSIFIGGGTPSLISPSIMAQLIELLHLTFDLSKVKEFTIEANPGEAPIDSLKEFHQMGINRLSLGAQSLNPKILKFLSRIHDTKQIYETFDNARTAGFENINCDMIFNIPNQSLNTWKHDLSKIASLGPEHLSCYSLTVENGTQLYNLVKNNKVSMPLDDESFNFYDWTQQFLLENQYHQYEVSNWSKDNKKCFHNLHYWRIEPYLAFGPSAHGFDGQIRYSNIRNIDTYIKSLDKNELPIQNQEELTDKNMANELIGFGLRMKEGIKLNKIPNSQISILNHNIEKFESKWGKYMHNQNGRLSLKSNGMRFADAVAIDLIIE